MVHGPACLFAEFDNSLQNYTAFFSSDGYMGQLETAYYNYANLPNNDIDQFIVEILNDVGDLAGVNLAQLYGLLANSSSIGMIFSVKLYSSRIIRHNCCNL